MKLEQTSDPKIKTIISIAFPESFTNVLNKSPKIMNGNKNRTIDFIVKLIAKIICLICKGTIGFNRIAAIIVMSNSTGNFFNISHFKTTWSRI